MLPAIRLTRTRGTDMQRLSNPSLVPTSQSPGGEVHSNAAAMTAPGSPGVAPMPVGLVETLPLPIDSGPEIPVSTESGRDDGGRFAQSGPWQSAGESGHGWSKV